MSEDIENIKKLLELKIDDIGRLEHIKKALENNEKLYVSDREYLEKITNQHLTKPDIQEEQTSKNASQINESSTIEGVEQQFCGNCGNKLDEHNNFCPKCGSIIKNYENKKDSTKYIPDNTQVKYPRGSEWKSLSTTTIFAVILGLLGVQGVGHFYLGKIGRGVAVLLAPLLSLLIATGIILMLASISYYAPERVIIGYVVGVIACIVFYIFIFFWQIFDARKLCNYYNDYVEKNGKNPW